LKLKTFLLLSAKTPQTSGVFVFEGVLFSSHFVTVKAN